MSLFLETIRIEQGKPCNLPYHTARIQRTLNNSLSPNWEEIIQITPSNLRIKCRILYSTRGIEEVTYAPYTLRPIQQFRLVAGEGVDYHFKWVNRDALNELFQQRGVADEVIITQNGCLTDTSIANIALFNGTDWVTPKNPLLFGTKRAQLLADGVITEGIIRVEELSNYSHIRCFNAMIEWGELELSTSAIV